jgi:Delta3,5-Delta2,4-dienoyl-CoA isomerase
MEGLMNLRLGIELSPVAVQSTKHLLDHALNHSIQDGLDYTAAWNMGMLQTQVGFFESF